MSLCKELGIPTRRQLLQQMSSRELSEWIAYAIVENEDMDARASSTRRPSDSGGPARPAPLRGEATVPARGEPPELIPDHLFG